MATLTKVIQTLNETNDDATKRHRDIKITLEKGISDISQSLNSIQRAGIKLPGLGLLIGALTDNPLTRAIGNITNTITRAVTAPYRLVARLISTVKDSVMGIFTGLGKIFKDIVTAPLSKAFGLLTGLFSTNHEKENNKILGEILKSIDFLNHQFDSYFDYLKNQKLDNIPQASDGDGAPIRPDNNQNIQEQSRGGIMLGIGGFLKIATGIITGVGLALVAELTGFDKYLKAFFLSERFTKIFKIFPAIADSIGSAFRLVSKGVNVAADIIKSNTFFATLGDMFRMLFSGVTEKIAKIGKAIGSVGSFFAKIGSLLSSVFKPIGALLRVVRVFARFTFLAPLITLFDFIKGAFTGFVDAEGGIFQKLLGALEGGVLGIIKGITAGLDVLIFGLPAFLLEKLGFTGLAEKFRGFSITALVDDLWSNIKGLFSKLNFKELTTRLANFKDEMLIKLSKISFSLPDITIPIPKFLGGGDFRLLKGFTVGVSETGAREAQRRIDQRNAALIQSRNAAEQESSARLNNAQTQLSNTIDSRNISAVQQNNAIDARSTQNNTTVLNQAPIPSSSDGFDRMVPI